MVSGKIDFDIVIEERERCHHSASVSSGFVFFFEVVFGGVSVSIIVHSASTTSNLTFCVSRRAIICSWLVLSAVRFRSATGTDDTQRVLWRTHMLLVTFCARCTCEYCVSKNSRRCVASIIRVKT